GELPPALPTLPDAAGLEEAGVFAVAGRTGHALGPAERREEGERGILVSEIPDRLSQRIGEAVGLGHAQRYVRGLGVSSMLLPLLDSGLASALPSRGRHWVCVVPQNGVAGVMDARGAGDATTARQAQSAPTTPEQSVPRA